MAAGLTAEIKEADLMVSEDIEPQLLKDLVSKIEEENEIVRALQELTDEKVDEMSERCNKYKEEYEDREYDLQYDRDEKRKIQQLEDEYTEQISRYIECQLNLIIEPGNDRDKWKKKKNELPLYYFLRNLKPDERLQRIIMRIISPLNFSDVAWKAFRYNVLEREFEVFFREPEYFGRDLTALKYTFQRDYRPLLNVSPEGFRIVQAMKKSLEFEQLHDMLKNITDKAGETRLFYMHTDDEVRMYADLYKQRPGEMYELLSIQNKNKYTALHIKVRYVTKLIADTYTAKSRNLFLQLASITNHKNQTARELTSLPHHRETLAKLEKHIANNKYLMNHRPTILIIYNTENREGADEEALEIYDVCRSKFDQAVSLKKDQTKENIIKLIEQAAEKTVSALMVILLSHGAVGCIKDCNDESIELAEIEESMCKQNDKPKVLITQCCQLIHRKEKPVPYAPTNDHFCAIMSCVASEASERGNFIGELSEQIKKSGDNTNIFKIAVNVAHMMTLNEGGSEAEKRKLDSESDSSNKPKTQTPIIMSTLKATLCPTDDTWWWRFF